MNAGLLHNPSGGKLTDDDFTAINGRRDQLEGKIQERYCLAKDQASSERRMLRNHR